MFQHFKTTYDLLVESRKIFKHLNIFRKWCVKSEKNFFIKQQPHHFWFTNGAEAQEVTRASQIQPVVSESELLWGTLRPEKRADAQWGVQTQQGACRDRRTVYFSTSSGASERRSAERPQSRSAEAANTALLMPMQALASRPRRWSRKR